MSAVAGSQTRRRLRVVALALIGLLYVVSIPWYRDPGKEPGTWLGLPDWVAVALVCYVGVAILNSLAWLVTEVRDEPDSEDSNGPEGTGTL